MTCPLPLFTPLKHPVAVRASLDDTLGDTGDVMRCHHGHRVSREARACIYFRIHNLREVVVLLTEAPVMETKSEQGFQKTGSVLFGGAASQSARLCHSQNQLCWQWGLFSFWENRRSDSCLEAGGWDPIVSTACEDWAVSPLVSGSRASPGTQEWGGGGHGALSLVLHCDPRV